MKQTISYFLFVMVLSLSSVASLAEDTTLPQKTPSERIIKKSPSDENVAQKSLTASSPSDMKGDTKNGKSLSGEFPLMSQPDVGTGIIQVTFGLFIVLLIIGAAAWFTRRFGHLQSTAGGAMRIVGGLHLGARERLVVVQVGDEQLLLGVAPGRVSTLHVLPKPLHQDESKSKRTQQIPGAFLDKLNAVLKKEGNRP